VVPSPPEPSETLGAGSFAEAFARLLVGLRWWVIAFWVSAAVASLTFLPALSEAKGGDGLKGLLPSDTPAVQNEIRSVEIFGFPLLGRTALVQRNPDGLSVYDQARTVTNAVALNRGRYEGLGPVRGALPILNTFGLFPSSSERDTTAVTYLFFPPGPSFSRQAESARNYAKRFFSPRDDVVGVTGSVPARAQQGRIIRDNLPLVELATLTAIVLIVGISFRSVVAPVLALCVAALAYVITLRLSGFLAVEFGVASPSELEPVVVALLLGVVTDYVVFFCSALRHELADGATRHDAARAATAQFGPIVGVAGLAVAAGTASLLVAGSAFFKALGPALIFTVLIALCMAITLLPALMAVLGRAIFWPTRPFTAGPAHVARAFSAPVSWIAHRRRSAAFTALGCSAGLLILALPLLRLELGVSFVGALPTDTNVRRAAAAAEAGFAPGILSPTVVVVEGEDIALQRRRLARLGERLEELPGVAGVLGPGDPPRRLETGLLLSGKGDAARYLVVLDDAPLGAGAIRTVDLLADQLPGLLSRSGLREATAGLAGDSATASYIVAQTERDLLRIGVAALLANLLMLVVFLRAVVAALYLLAASVLSLAASLGLTTWVFAQLNPGEGLTFYVPFAAAVLLLAFGSDYNIFGVGHVWDEARHRRLQDAIAVAMPRTIKAITAAGLALAASFGLLAIVPIQSFRQLAFAMFVGILLDVFVVRSLLMPALLKLVGPASAWPSRRLYRLEAEAGPGGSARHPQ